MDSTTKAVLIRTSADETVILTAKGQPVALIPPNSELLVAVQDGEVRLDF